MRRFKGLILGMMTVVVILGLVFGGCAPAPAPEKPAPVAPKSEPIEWNCSLWGAPRAMLEPLERWAKEMEERTGGRFKVELHWGEVLSPVKESLDGLKAGLYEMGSLVPWYYPGKVPLQTGLGLPFLSPPEISEIATWYWEGMNHPALVKELEKWDAKALLALTAPQYQIMCTKPIRKVEDFKGVRIRIAADQGRVIEAFGAVPTMFPAPETYGAIDKGMLDGVCLPWTYGLGAYKIYEVCDYTIVGLDLGALGGGIVVHKDAWAALPEDIKRVHEELLLKYPGWNVEAYAVADEKFVPIFKEHTEIIQFPPEERAKLVKEAGKIWEGWVKAREAEGLPGREVLDFLIKKTEEAAK